MSELTDAVELRYNNQELIALTNAGEVLSATTINQPRLDAAADDVIAALLTPNGIEFDAADSQHLEIACEGVILRLKTFGKSLDRAVRGDWRKWKTDEVDRLAKYERRARIQPQTSSPDPLHAPRPLDARRFEDYIPDAPPVGVLPEDT